MRTRLLLLSIAFCNIAIAQSPSWQWAKQVIITTSNNGSANGACTSYLSDMDLDGNNDIYLTVPAGGKINIMNSNTINSANGYISFLIKTSSNGTLLWADTIGTDIGSIAVEKNTGNMYFSGRFTGTLKVGSKTFSTAPNDYDICVVKYNGNGSVLWADVAGSDSVDGVSNHSTGTDDAGNCFVAGTFDNDTISFQGMSLIPMGNQNGFVTKYNSNGSVLWTRQIGGAGCDAYISTMCVDKNGNSYITGSFSAAALSIGTFTLAPVSSWPTRDIFLAKYDSSGNVAWAKQIQYSGDQCGSYGNGITNMVSNETGLFIAGTFDDTLNFGNNNMLISGGYCDMFAAKYDSAGNLNFAKQATGSGDQIGRDIQVDGMGNFYVTGNCGYGGTGKFDAISISYASNSYTAYVAKYNPSGVVQWVKTTNVNSGGSVGEAMACTPGGDCFLTGGIVYTVGFDNSFVSTASFITDLVFARLGNSSITSVEHNESLGNITVYPNPFSSSSTIRLNDPVTSAEVTIYDLYGQKIRTIKNISGQEINIGRENLPGGVYFINVMENDKIIATNKLVITDN